MGLAVSWRTKLQQVGSPDDIAWQTRWGWVFPVIAGTMGAYSALLAVFAESFTDQTQPWLTIMAVLGVILAWILVHAGFAQFYQVLDATTTGKDAIGLEFPGDNSPVTINYLYFSFTIGTTFSTSDAHVGSIRIRKVVILNSVLSFFYNALVIAIALQVFQQFIRN